MEVTMASFEYIHCLVTCQGKSGQCGNKINIRAKFGKSVGYIKTEACWNCGEVVELRGRAGWQYGKRIPTEEISSETKHE
jgi:hypothetical protein